jgi:hypothetical protein
MTAIDYNAARWAPLTWSDWEVLEDALRVKRVAAVKREAQRESWKSDKLDAYIDDIRHELVPFDDVHRFARWDSMGVYLAAQLSLAAGGSNVTLEDIRAEFPTATLMVRMAHERDIFGVRLTRASEAQGGTPAANPTPPSTGQPSGQ